eukprot:Gb_05878 [translate_table: standard]
MIVRATLKTGEDGCIDLFLIIIQNLLTLLVNLLDTLPVKDHCTTRTTE